MTHQIIKQPDGKLAIFSHGVDSWIRGDMTAEDVGEYYASRAADNARASALETARAALAGEPGAGLGMYTFAELNAIARKHGHEPLPGPVDEKMLREGEE